MMKYFLVLLLTALSASSSAAAKECCLCDECGPVDPEKVELFTVSPFKDQPEGATCEDIALELLDHDEGSEMCASVRLDLHQACCTSHFDESDIEEGQLAAYIRGARELWGNGWSASSNRNRNRSNVRRNNNRSNVNRNRSSGSYQRPGSNGTRYNTRGGNFSCSMCQGRNVLRFQQMVMRDPSRGQTIRASCPQLIANFKAGMYSNNMCNIGKINAHRMCCPAGTSRNNPRVTGNLGSSWSARRGGW